MEYDCKNIDTFRNSVKNKNIFVQLKFRMNHNYAVIK